MKEKKRSLTGGRGGGGGGGERRRRKRRFKGVRHTNNSENCVVVTISISGSKAWWGVLRAFRKLLRSSVVGIKVLGEIGWEVNVASCAVVVRISIVMRNKKADDAKRRSRHLSDEQKNVDLGEKTSSWNSTKWCPTYKKIKMTNLPDC